MVSDFFLSPLTMARVRAIIPLYHTKAMTENNACIPLRPQERTAPGASRPAERRKFPPELRC